MDHLKNFFFPSTIAVSLFYGFMTIYSLFFCRVLVFCDLLRVSLVWCECFSPVCFNMIEEAYITKCGHSFWYVDTACVLITVTDGIIDVPEN